MAIAFHCLDQNRIPDLCKTRNYLRQTIYQMTIRCSRISTKLYTIVPRSWKWAWPKHYTWTVSNTTHNRDTGNPNLSVLLTTTCYLVIGFGYTRFIHVFLHSRVPCDLIEFLCLELVNLSSQSVSIQSQNYDYILFICCKFSIISLISVYCVPFYRDFLYGNYDAIYRLILVLYSFCYE